MGRIADEQIKQLFNRVGELENALRGIIRTSDCYIAISIAENVLDEEE